MLPHYWGAIFYSMLWDALCFMNLLNYSRPQITPSYYPTCLFPWFFPSSCNFHIHITSQAVQGDSLHTSRVLCAQLSPLGPSVLYPCFLLQRRLVIRDDKWGCFTQIIFITLTHAQHLLLTFASGTTGLKPKRNPWVLLFPYFTQLWWVKIHYAFLPISQMMPFPSLAL